MQILFPEEVINQLINLIDVEEEPQLYQAINLYFDTYPLVGLRNKWNDENFVELSLKEKINFIASIDINNSNYTSDKKTMQETFQNTLNNQKNEKEILEIINKDEEILANIMKISLTKAETIPDYLKELFITLSILDYNEDNLSIIINFINYYQKKNNKKFLWIIYPIL